MTDNIPPSTWVRIAPFIFTLAATAFGFVLNQTWLQSKDRRERLQKIISLLAATELELHFYAQKLVTLGEFLQTRDIQREHSGMKGVVVPSFDLYPAFLEKVKIDLVDFHETADLVQLVGGCHFELGHIQAKLESYRKHAEHVRDAAVHREVIIAMALNAGGLSKLAKDNVKMFEEAGQKVAAKKREMMQALEQFYETNVFGNILRH